MWQGGCRWSLQLVVLAIALISLKADAQADYPFRDPKFSDDVRIADLLKRLTLDEKVELMDGHPRIPRLHLVFSDEAEGLHGLALGGPGSVGAAWPPASAHDDLSAGKGPGRDLGYCADKGSRRSRRGRSALLLPEPGLRFRRDRSPRAQHRPEPRSALGPHRGVDG